ncbi:HAD-IIIC family phosphatase [Prochlorococcus marinus]|uniref:HAD-IIIC family phosphatase n=1 Tax=Prochlorococcus marinus TaxID=1219 RepID=UPI001ADB0561|nr:HAD-IIIC family phosphatase [Prochlorococcus marinus]MBO8204972.1 HAD-IIIC family phosphatase [Prochlorococcus marinus CUG1415]MBW3044245.1 hypothetical protein [Prochlorococcus marinus str. MU1415]
MILNVICDSELYLFNKVAKENNILIKDFISYDINLYEYQKIGEGDLIIMLSETFYKIISSNLYSYINSKTKLYEELEKLDMRLKVINENSSNIFLFAVPRHFIYKDNSDEIYPNNSYDGFIDLLNAELFILSNKYSNVIFFKGISQLEQSIDKVYFRFSSIYDKQNSNILIKQIQEFYSINSIKNKKLIIFDLDNTIWKGLVGEDTITGIRMDKSDPVGSVFYQVQNILLKFKNNGFLLAICSKNDEDIALKALFDNPACLLKEEDVVTYRINWNNKSDNIISICSELNISPQDTIFIDDSDYECDEVKKLLNEIEVIKVPKNIYSFPEFLIQKIFLGINRVTEEDKKRTKLYKDRIKRFNLLTKYHNNSHLDWIKSLNINLNIYSIEPSDPNLDRCIQLFNRTNQFNLKGSKYNKKSIFKQLINGDYYYGYLSDNVGAEGIISVIGFQNSNNKIKVIDFILSCRVFGKSIEDAMLLPLLEQSKADEKDVFFDFVSTKQNKSIEKYLSNLTKKAFSLSKKDAIKHFDYINKLPIKVIRNYNPDI